MSDIRESSGFPIFVIHFYYVAMPRLPCKSPIQPCGANMNVHIFFFRILPSSFGLSGWGLYLDTAGVDSAKPGDTLFSAVSGNEAKVRDSNLAGSRLFLRQ